MNTTIEFTLKTQKNQQEVETSFIFEYNEEGECIDAQAFNPTSGYTNMTQWRTGWSEQDPELETMWDALEEYSRSMALNELVSSMTQEDINKEYETEYYCEDYVDEKKTYKFTVTCYNIEEGDE